MKSFVSLSFLVCLAATLNATEAQPKYAADVYASYFGGSLGEHNIYIAVDPNGCVILAGHTYSTNLPVKNAVQPSNKLGPCDGFVAKFTPDMTALVFSTYLGGTGYDEIKDVAVNQSGNIFVTGITNSGNYPITTQPISSTYSGADLDAFLTQLDPNGQLVYSTYLGGNGEDVGYCVAAFKAAQICVAGYTTSTDFPLASALSETNQGGRDLFISYLDLNNHTLTFSTYLGGSGSEIPGYATFDTYGHLYICGMTQSSDFPVKAGFNSGFHGGQDGFVLKLDSHGELIYTSLIGGSGNDGLQGLALGPSDEVYLIGSSDSPGLTTSNQIFKDTPQGNDVILAKINASGDELQYLSYFGGPGSDTGSKIHVLDADVVAVTGMASSGFPLTSNAYDPTIQNSEFFVSVLDLAQTEILYSSFLGGRGNEYLYDGCGMGQSFYLSGLSESSDFPVSLDAYARNRRGNDEAVLARFTFRPIEDPNGPVQNVSTGIRYHTVCDAVTYAQDNEEIVLDLGIHPGRIVLTHKDLRLRSIDPNNPYYIGGTIIQGDPNEPAIALSNNTDACQLTGLTLRAGSIGVSGTGTDATLRNCRIMDNLTHGMELSEGSSPYLKHCLITANGQTGITMLPGSGRDSLPCRPVIENCIIVDNGDTAIEGGEPTVIDSIISETNQL